MAWREVWTAFAWRLVRVERWAARKLDRVGNRPTVVDPRGIVVEGPFWTPAKRSGGAARKGNPPDRDRVAMNLPRRTGFDPVDLGLVAVAALVAAFVLDREVERRRERAIRAKGNPPPAATGEGRSDTDEKGTPKMTDSAAMLESYADSSGAKGESTEVPQPSENERETLPAPEVATDAPETGPFEAPPADAFRALSGPRIRLVDCEVCDACQGPGPLLPRALIAFGVDRLEGRRFRVYLCRTCEPWADVSPSREGWHTPIDWTGLGAEGEPLRVYVGGGMEDATEGVEHGDVIREAAYFNGWPGASAYLTGALVARALRFFAGGSSRPLSELACEAWDPARDLWNADRDMQRFERTPLGVLVSAAEESARDPRGEAPRCVSCQAPRVDWCVCASEENDGAGVDE